jgi:molecular chaperone DnaK
LDVSPLSLGLETIGGVMKKLLPRNTTIPVRKSDIFSTGDNNQTMVEIHVLQGEREMATDNKSLGRFKLTGIPPAPRGLPQIQVSFDIDANGILQVTARDKTTGREQSITVQGASTLSEFEVNRMIQEAEQFADEDRERRERIEKRNKAKALTDQAQRRLKEVTLDFGSAFTVSYRRQVEALSGEILDALAKEDERRLDRAQADLQDVLYELNREVRLQYADEDEGFFSAIRKTFTGDDDDEELYGSRSGYRENVRPSRDENRGASYRSPSAAPRDNYGSGFPQYDEPRNVRKPRYSNYDAYEDYPEQGDYDYNRPTPPRQRPTNNGDLQGRPGRDRANSWDNERNSTGKRGRPMPPENNWDDDDDDDWF